MRTNLEKNVRDLEHAVMFCTRNDYADELNQIPSEYDIIADLMHDSSGQPIDQIRAEYHHA